MCLFTDDDIDQINLEHQGQERDALTEEERGNQDAQALADHLAEEEKWRRVEKVWREERRNLKQTRS
jgi:CO/xanthine dehydrogenase Mo-binding subunit